MKELMSCGALMLLAVVLAMGCSTPAGYRQSSSLRSDDVRRQVSAILSASQGRATRILEVPSPDNFLSEKIMLASLAAGAGSTAMDELTRFLSSGKSAEIGVAGKSSAVNAATVQGALEQLAGKPSSAKLYVVADADTTDSLQEVARKAGVQLVIVNQTE